MLSWSKTSVPLVVALLAAACSAEHAGVSPSAEDASASGEDASPAPGDAPVARDAAVADAGASDAAAPDDATDPLDAADAAADAADGAIADAYVAPDAALGDCTDDGGSPGGAPRRLACTGLYAVWPSRTVASDALPYDPGLHLWSDGADKSRWIRLPPGTRIDTHDMDEWSFPTGTKIWKEFRLNGQRVETRFLWKRGDGDWVRATYAWSDDESDAVRLVDGATNVRGTSYEIPPESACATCHAGRIDFVLGFEAVSLASPAASGLTLAELEKRGLLTTPPSTPPVVPGAGTPAQAALGWLHANCGTACHNRSPNAWAGSTGLWMRLEVARLASVDATDTYTTAVSQPSGFQPYPDAGFMRIAPHDVAHSAIPFRDGTRDDQGQGFQMPPIDTHVVPADGVALVRSWIDAM